MEIKALGRSILISSIFLALVMTEMIVYGGFGISVVISVMIYLCCVFYFANRLGKKQNNIAKWLLGAIILDTLCFALFNDIVLEFFNILLLLILLGVHALIFFKEERCELFTSKWCKNMAANWFRLPFAHLTAPIKIIKEEVNDKQNETIKGIGAVLVKILLGLVIAVPILGIVIALLCSADAAFEGLMIAIDELIIHIQIEGIVGRTFVVSILFFIVSSCFCTILMEDKKEVVNTNEQEENRNDAVSIVEEVAEITETAVQEATIGEESRLAGKEVIQLNEEKTGLDFTVVATVVTLIGSIYLLYCLSQFTYFISAFQGILPENFTRAEYARRGFFEALPIVGFNLMIIYVLNVWVRISGGRIQKLYIKGMTLFIIGFSGFIAASALAKMFMYMRCYGLTQKRIYVAWFLILTLLVLGVILFRIWFAQINIVKVVCMLFMVMYLGLNYANVDYIVGNYNITLYEEGRLDNLSACYGLNSTVLIRLDKLVQENPEMKYDSDVQDLITSFVRYGFHNNSWKQWNVADRLAEESWCSIKEIHAL